MREESGPAQAIQAKPRDGVPLHEEWNQKLCVHDVGAQATFMVAQLQGWLAVQNTARDLQSGLIDPIKHADVMVKADLFVLGDPVVGYGACWVGCTLQEGSPAVSRNPNVILLY